jgi:hypothetical protein
MKIKRLDRIPRAVLAISALIVSLPIAASANELIRYTFEDLSSPLTEGGLLTTLLQPRSLISPPFLVQPAWILSQASGQLLTVCAMI